jgi:hypothetical protein
MSAISKALDHHRGMVRLAVDLSIKAKGGGGYGGFEVGAGGGTDLSQAANKQRYNQFRGWVHSAINALAMKASKQPVFVGRATKTAKKNKPAGSKAKLWLPNSIRMKTQGSEVEIEPDHEFMPALEHPNMMQHRVAFVYSFVANMCLTGWGYVAAGKSTSKDAKGKKQDKIDFFGLPTSWVQPIHDNGPFSQFKIINPNDPAASADAKPLDRSAVGFAQFPNPADPLAAMSPTQAQQHGIKIDDSIQSSQTMFFDNGIFPGAIVTVGQNPTGTANAGFRPRLTAVQRRQVYAAVERLMGGVANYGRPAIVDGLIEKVERLTMNAQEMGWEKSEKAARSRILSGLGTHPFILAEEMAGSYAQAYIVESLFCERVNFFLDMLSTLMTDLARAQLEQDDLVVWWEATESRDPSLEANIINMARQRGDMRAEEFRTWFGLPPEEDAENRIDRSIVPTVMGVASQVAGGMLQPEQGQVILEAIGVPSDIAKKIAGKGPAKPDAMSEEQAIGAASKALESVVGYLSAPIDGQAERILLGI